MVRDIESGQEHRIPQIVGDVGRLFAAISPSGKYIVYNAHVLQQPNETLNDYDIVVAGVDDNSTHVVGHGGFPKWSPKGDNILFTRNDQGGRRGNWTTHIWVVNPDGSGLRRLNSSKGMQGWPVVWSPDGRYIMNDAGNELHIVDVYADTCWVLPIDNLTKPTDKYRAEIADWAWFPDGKSVLLETVLISGPDDEMEGMQWYKIEMQDKSIAKVDLPIEAHEGDAIIWLNNSTVLFQDKAGSWNEAHIGGEGQ